MAYITAVNTIELSSCEVCLVHKIRGEGLAQLDVRNGVIHLFLQTGTHAIVGREQTKKGDQVVQIVSY